MGGGLIRKLSVEGERIASGVWFIHEGGRVVEVIFTRLFRVPAGGAASQTKNPLSATARQGKAKRKPMVWMGGRGKADCGKPGLEERGEKEAYRSHDLLVVRPSLATKKQAG